MPNDVSTTPALKRAQNGSIGEARTRSFLLNRFWVLERSVDIDGADFLIQPRLTDRTKLELQRMGIVQAKFVQDGNTGLKIPKHYVLGDDGEPRGEFFLLVCTGEEDLETMYLLTAKDVTEDFTLKDDSYRVKAKRIFDTGNRRIVLKAQALNRIERSLGLTNLKANRRYLQTHGYVQPEQSHIDPDLAESLSNWYGDIPGGFHAAKKAADDLLTNVGVLSDALERMTQTTDPVEFFGIYEIEVSEYVDGHDKIVVGDNSGIWDESLLNVVQGTRDYRKQLEAKGLLSAFPAVLGALVREIKVPQIQRQLVAPFPAMHARLEFDASTLQVISISVRAETKRCDGALLLRPDHWSYAERSRPDERVAILEDSVGVIDVCLTAPHFDPRWSTLESLRQSYATQLGVVFQILLHRRVFGTDDGLI